MRFPIDFICRMEKVDNSQEVELEDTWCSLQNWEFDCLTTISSALHFATEYRNMEQLLLLVRCDCKSEIDMVWNAQYSRTECDNLLHM